MKVWITFKIVYAHIVSHSITSSAIYVITHGITYSRYDFSMKPKQTKLKELVEHGTKSQCDFFK